MRKPDTSRQGWNKCLSPTEGGGELVSVPPQSGSRVGSVFHAREGRIFSASASSAGSFSASRRKLKGLEPRGLMLRQTISNFQCLSPEGAITEWMSPKGFRCRVVSDYGAENLGFQYVECCHIAKCKYRMFQEHGADRGWRRSLAPNAAVPDWKCNYGADQVRKSLSPLRKPKCNYGVDN